MCTSLITRLRTLFTRIPRIRLSKCHVCKVLGHGACREDVSDEDIKTPRQRSPSESWSSDWDEEEEDDAEDDAEEGDEEQVLLRQLLSSMSSLSLISLPSWSSLSSSEAEGLEYTLGKFGGGNNKYRQDLEACAMRLKVRREREEVVEREPCHSGDASEEEGVAAVVKKKSCALERSKIMYGRGGRYSRVSGEDSEGVTIDLV